MGPPSREGLDPTGKPSYIWSRGRTHVRWREGEREIRVIFGDGLADRVYAGSPGFLEWAAKTELGKSRDG